MKVTNLLKNQPHVSQSKATWLAIVLFKGIHQNKMEMEEEEKKNSVQMKMEWMVVLELLMGMEMELQVEVEKVEVNQREAVKMEEMENSRVKKLRKMRKVKVEILIGKVFMWVTTGFLKSLEMIFIISLCWKSADDRSISLYLLLSLFHSNPFTERSRTSSSRSHQRRNHQTFTNRSWLWTKDNS